MATDETLKLARRLLIALGAQQAQVSLSRQARDCAPIVEALGYYDLGNHLRDLAERRD